MSTIIFTYVYIYIYIYIHISIYAQVEDDMEDVGEIFHVQIALGNELKYSESTLRLNQMSRKNTAGAYI